MTTLLRPRNIDTRYGPVSCFAPLRTRPLDHARGRPYRGPGRLPGPDLPWLAVPSSLDSSCHQDSSFLHGAQADGHTPAFRAGSVRGLHRFIGAPFEASRCRGWRAVQHRDAGQGSRPETAPTLADRSTNDQGSLKREVAALERRTRELGDEVDRRTDRDRALEEAQRTRPPAAEAPTPPTPALRGGKNPSTRRPPQTLNRHTVRSIAKTTSPHHKGADGPISEKGAKPTSRPGKQCR